MESLSLAGFGGGVFVGGTESGINNMSLALIFGASLENMSDAKEEDSCDEVVAPSSRSTDDDFLVMLIMDGAETKELVAF